MLSVKIYLPHTMSRESEDSQTIMNLLPEVSAGLPARMSILVP